MSTSTTKLKRLIAALQRRSGWAAVTLLAVAAATGVILVKTPPSYRATATLRIDGMTLPNEVEADDAASFAARHMRERRERIAEASRTPGGRELAIARADVRPAAGPYSSTITIDFEIAAVADDWRAAEGAAARLAAAYRDDHLRAAGVQDIPEEDLEAARAEVAAAAESLGEAEAELEALGWRHEGASELRAVTALAAERARGEHTQLSRELVALEARRNELDRYLGDMQRGATAYQRERGVLTSDMLVALQARKAMLSGLYGSNYREAIALGELIGEARADVTVRFDAANAELEEVRAEFQRLQRTHPLDHPDVVRLAHRLSGLERRVEALRVTGLSSSDQAYIERLGAERREIDGEIDAMREAVAAAEARIAESRARAEQAPVLELRYRDLQYRREAAEEVHDEAKVRLAALEARVEAARASHPGTMTVIVPPRAANVPASRPEVIAAAGALGALFAVLLVVGLLERLDRRVTGAASIARLQGVPPLAVIPVLAGR